jgi:hypothetical protein
MFGQISRGRDAPFPAPVLPVGVLDEKVKMGLEERVKAGKYKELYAIASPAGGWGNQNKEKEKVVEREKVAEREKVVEKKVEKVVEKKMATKVATKEPVDDSEGNGYWDAYGLLGDDEGENEEEDMRNVLDRFEGEMRQEVGQALESSRSLEFLKSNHQRTPSGSYSYAVTTGRQNSPDDDDRSVYTDEDADAEEDVWGGPDVHSRWSGSIYSRTSVSEVETSEERRERLVRKVGEMFDDSGRKSDKFGGVVGGMDLPPVPKIPRGAGGAHAVTGVNGRPKWRF